MTEYIKNQLIKLCDNPEWFNDMLNTWDFKPERESQAIKEYTDTYDFATFDKEATNGEPPYPSNRNQYIGISLLPKRRPGL